MSRIRPDGRRRGESFELWHDEQRYFVMVGFMPDDRTPLEVFISAEKSASTLEALARDAAILVSFALQYGAPLAELKAAVTRGDMGVPPSTVIGAVLDAILARWPAKEAAG